MQCLEYHSVRSEHPIHVNHCFFHCHILSVSHHSILKAHMHKISSVSAASLLISPQTTRYLEKLGHNQTQPI